MINIWSFIVIIHGRFKKTNYFFYIFLVISNNKRNVFIPILYHGNAKNEEIKIQLFAFIFH